MDLGHAISSLRAPIQAEVEPGSARPSTRSGMGDRTRRGQLELEEKSAQLFFEVWMNTVEMDGVTIECTGRTSPQSGDLDLTMVID
jgi:hypothetical protein